MRAIGPSVVILSLIFTAGGVAYRTQAGPQVQADMTLVADSAGGHDASQCEVVDGPPPRPFSLDLSKLPAKAGEAVMPLNGTGYNYREPGLWQPPREPAPPLRQPAPASPRD